MPMTFLTFVEYESTTSYDGNDLFDRAFDSTDQSGNVMINGICPNWILMRKQIPRF